MEVRKKFRPFSLLFFCLLFSCLSSSLAAGVEIKVIQSLDDLPAPFSTLAKKGDILIADGTHYALFGATPRPLRTSANYPYGNTMGSILGFVPAIQKSASDLNIGAPVLRIKDRTRHVTYSTLEQIKRSGAEAQVIFEAQAVFEDKEGRKALVKTTYVFHPGKGRIDISSVLTNTGKGNFEDLSFSLFFDAYARYYFNPYQEKKFPHLNFRVYQKKGHSLGWVNLNPVEKEEKRYPGRLAPGEKCELRYVLFGDASHQAILESIYELKEIKPVHAAVSFKGFDGDWMELVVREAISSSIFFRSILEEPVYEELPLPPGVYRFQAHFFPATVEELVEIRPEGKNTCELQNPAQGLVKVKIKNSQEEHVPGKVTFLGLAPTKTPYFRPDNPVETGRSWESFKNSCYPGEEGLEVPLPVGTYLVYASRGPEYTIDQKVLEVVKDEVYTLVFRIDKVVQTPGLVSLDPHMHTSKSDGSVSVEERIKSVIAEGVDAAVATDHNTITDYAAALRKLRLDRSLAVIPGNEVTTPDVIHFNTYPLKVRPDEPGNGAINPASDEAGPLFRASREKHPGVILQVNHPRAGNLGYFNNLALDQESAATALTSFDTNFDLLEVLNGPYYYVSNQAAIEDWFHLLNRGYFFPLVGSSDSHIIDKGEPGYSRTYVFYSGEKAEWLDWPSLLQALKKGRSFATNGPLIEFMVNGPSKPGDLLEVKAGKVDIHLEVRSAPWVDVSEVRLVLNGQRRIIFPVRAKETDILKFEQDISLTLKEDTSICIEAAGTKTLFPVLQESSTSGLLEDAAIPYALTNPVFIDVDGNQKFNPPLAEKIRLTDKPAGSQKKVSRH